MCLIYIVSILALPVEVDAIYLIDFVLFLALPTAVDAIYLIYFVMPTCT
jgi:hypothetical protein